MNLLYKFVYRLEGDTKSDHCLFNARNLIEAKVKAYDFVKEQRGYEFEDAEVHYVGKYQTITNHLSFHHGMFSIEEIQEMNSEDSN